jgi:hypothetical protein
MQNRSSKRPDAPVEPAPSPSLSLFPVNETAAAWASVQDEAESLAEDAVESPRVDLQLAAGVTRRVAQDILGDAKLLARFEVQVRAQEIDAGLPERLITLSDAAWHARRQQAEADVTSAASPLGAAVAQAGEVRARMHDLTEYHFGKDPVEGPRVAQAAGSHGHLHLANALDTYADLYERHHAVVSKDTKNYCPTDARDARRLAGEIRTALASDSGAAYALWTGRCARAWVLLSSAYAEVQSTGRWLLRRTPRSAEERFPSLVEGSKSTRRKRRKAPADAATPTGATPTGTPTTPRTTRPKRRRKR